MKLTAAAPKPEARSKGTWVNLIIAVAAFFPEVAVWISQHPTETVAGLSILNQIVKVVTKKKWVLWHEKEQTSGKELD